MERKKSKDFQERGKERQREIQEKIGQWQLDPILEWGHGSFGCSNFPEVIAMWQN
jgi:hypothetical protein